MDLRNAVAYITGTVYEESPLRNEYLLAENRILIQQLQGCLRLTGPKRQTRSGSRLAAVAVKAAAFIWELVRVDILTIRGVGLFEQLSQARYHGRFTVA